MTLLLLAAARRNEQRMTDQGYVLLRSMALVDGYGVGYTEMFLSSGDPAIVHQDDTFVDRDYRDYRGRGFGAALKSANLRQLLQMPDAAGARFVQSSALAELGALEIKLRTPFCWKLRSGFAGVANVV